MHNVWREPWEGRGCGHRRLPAGDRPHRDRYTALPRPETAGKGPLESARQELDRVEIFSGTFGEDDRCPHRTRRKKPGCPVGVTMPSGMYSGPDTLTTPGRRKRAPRPQGRRKILWEETLARVAAGAVAMRCLAPQGIESAGGSSRSTGRWSRRRWRRRSVPPGMPGTPWGYRRGDGDRLPAGPRGSGLGNWMPPSPGR